MGFILLRVLSYLIMCVDNLISFCVLSHYVCYLIMGVISLCVLSHYGWQPNLWVTHLDRRTLVAYYQLYTVLTKHIISFADFVEPYPMLSQHHVQIHLQN